MKSLNLYVSILQHVGLILKVIETMNAVCTKDCSNHVETLIEVIRLETDIHAGSFC